MQVVYAPQDEPTSGWVKDFDPAKVFADEAELIENHWSNPWDHFIMHVQGRSMKALKLLMWHLMRADHPRAYANLKDVPRFRTGDIKIMASSAELVEQKRILDTEGVLTPAEHAQATAAFDVDYAAALEREGKTAEEATAAAEAEQPETVAVPALPPTSEPSPTFGGATG